MGSEAECRQAIVEAGRRLYERFFIAANDGNISCRLSGGEILVTPTGVNKGDLQPEQILKVDAEGRLLSGSLKPTSELKMHLLIYRLRPDLSAIVHAHPPAATGFAAARVRLDKEVVLPEVVFGLGRIGFAEYGTPSTEELPRAVEAEIGGCDALLLSNHGALTGADTVMKAYYRMETLEMYCRVLLVTRLLGGARSLSEKEVEQLYRVREQQGWAGREDSTDQKTIDLVVETVLEVLKRR
jgi:L-fuculose-phosphate aldolase